MKDLLDKLSSYNLFNYLLPGILFAFFIDSYTPFKILQKDIVVGVFLYYFLGLVISRVGSLIVEPILKKTKLIQFSKYDDFVQASKNDAKLEILSEANNMYRTLCALFLLDGIVLLYCFASQYFPILKATSPYILLLFLFILFLSSYRKQTTYIAKRVNVNQSQQ